MSDQTAPEETTAAELPEALGGPPASPLDNILSLEKVMNSARLVEKIARVCLRGDLEAELLDTLEELAALVDVDGHLLDGEEAALGDTTSARAEELSERAKAVREQMAAETYVVRFRSLDDDAWDQFEKANRGADGRPKDIREYNNKLIAATAIAPTMTLGAVEGLRARLSAKQMNELANQAYAACTQGGLDVPKLPSFSHFQKPKDQ